MVPTMNASHPIYFYKSLRQQCLYSDAGMISCKFTIHIVLLDSFFAAKNQGNTLPGVFLHRLFPVPWNI